MDEEVIDYNLKAKVMFSVCDLTKRFNHNKLQVEKVFSIGSTEWSIELVKHKFRLNLYIGLKRSLQDSVGIDVKIGVKDKWDQKPYIDYMGWVGALPEDDCKKFKLGKPEDLNQYLVNDCLTICVDMKVDEFKLHNNRNYNFESVFNNQLLNDFKLIVKGKEFFVSKAILASRSPVFHSMFCNDMKEKNESQCVIEDIDVDVFEEFLNYIYSGKLSKIETMADKLLDISDRFQVKELVTICEQLLIFDLNINNALNCLIIADKHNSVELKAKAMKYILTNKSKFPVNDFLNLIKDYNQLAYEMIGKNVCKTESEDTLKVFTFSLS